MQFLHDEDMTPIVQDHEEIVVKHNHGREALHFHHRPAGPDYFPKIIEELHGRTLARASAPEMTALFVHAYNHPSIQYSNLVLDSLRHEAQVYADTGILVVHRTGALVEDFPVIKEGKVVMDQQGLFGRLGKDKKVRFVPEGYRIGYLDSEFVEVHPLIIGICGEEGAGRIAKIARDNGKRKVYVGSVPDIERKERKDTNHARIAAFRATAKDTFWVFSEYPDAHDNVFGFSYGIIKREETKAN